MVGNTYSEKSKEDPHNRIVTLSHGQTAIADNTAAVRALLRQAKYSAQAAGHNLFYMIHIVNGKRVDFAHELLGPAAANLSIYYRNGNSLDVRRANIGICCLDEALAPATYFYTDDIDKDVLCLELASGEIALLVACDNARSLAATFVYRLDPITGDVVRDVPYGTRGRTRTFTLADDYFPRTNALDPPRRFKFNNGDRLDLLSENLELVAEQKQ